jgi:hypothetical protein
VDLPLFIWHCLKELRIEQRDLAAAAHISQLLTAKKAPLIPERTDIHSKMERFLKLPGGKLEKYVLPLERSLPQEITLYCSSKCGAVIQRN